MISPARTIWQTLGLCSCLSGLENSEILCEKGKKTDIRKEGVKKEKQFKKNEKGEFEYL